MVIGMGWIVVEEREDYETLRYVYTSPIGMLTYLWGRSVVRFVLATISVVLTLAVGWWVVGVRWPWGEVHWGLLALALPLGLLATQYLGFLVAGLTLSLPRVAVTLLEGVAVALYLVCGVIFPVDLLPAGLRQFALALPFTWWYEALRRALLGHAASPSLDRLTDAQLLLLLAAATAVFVVLSHAGYRALDRHARRTGRIDQTSLF
jgi:ABC-2 type transport system permease protein